MRAITIWFMFPALAVSFVSSEVAAWSLPTTTVCNHCYSDASFKHQAEQTSLANRPLFEGLDYVYVINVSSEDVRHFEVHRWVEYDPEPYSHSRSSSEGETLSYNYGPARAEAIELPGDPSILASIDQAIGVSKNFSSQVTQGISSDDLGLPFDSAIALIGPETSPAGLHRNALKNMLHQHFNAILQTLMISVTDLAHRFVGKFLSESSAEFLKNVTVEFPDGTEVQVKIEEILDSLDGDVGFEFHVRVETISGPGLPAAPLNPGQFAGFRFSGNGVTVAELINLALLYNIPVSQAGGGGGGPGEMECEVDGDQIRCTVRYSGY